MKQLQRNQKVLKKASSFTVKNSIISVPINSKLVKKINGFKVISRGTDNLLPYQISKIVKDSATLSNIVYSKAEYVSSGEIALDNEQVKNKLLEDLNADYDFYELSKRLSIDYYTHGYAFIERVRIGTEVFIYHIPTEQVCLEEYETVPEMAVVSKDWNNKREKPYGIGIFPNETLDESDDVEIETYRSIMMLKDYDVSNSVYGLPKWVGAFYDAQVESLIGQYNANHFENGITLSAILSIDLGEYNTQEELVAAKSKLEKNIKGTSDGRSGKTLVHAANSGIDAPAYTIYPMEKEGSFAKLQETTENNIVKANQWFRSLAGLQTAGSLGNNQQLRNEWSLAERLINNFQIKVTDMVLKALDLESEYTFSNQTPVDLVGDYNAIKVVLESKEVLGLNATTQLLILMGLGEVQAEKMVNDSK